jgi:DNA-3-methyladenine glycosylase
MAMTSFELLSGQATIVAPSLLGWEIVSYTTAGVTAGRIVEVEAYHGVSDPASHAYRRQTDRNTPMYGPAGTIYVYRSYGIHLCLNLVTGPIGDPQAILIRALEPTQGLPLIQSRRDNHTVEHLMAGPGRVGQGLGITTKISGTMLGSALDLVPPSRPIDSGFIRTSPRIGLSAGTELAWRYYINGNPHVSRR